MTFPDAVDEKEQPSLVWQVAGGVLLANLFTAAFVLVAWLVWKAVSGS